MSPSRGSAGSAGKLFIPAHDVPCEDIAPLVQENLAAMNEVAADIEEMCELRRPSTTSSQSVSKSTISGCTSCSIF